MTALRLPGVLLLCLLPLAACDDAPGDDDSAGPDDDSADDDSADDDAAGDDDAADDDSTPPPYTGRTYTLAEADAVVAGGDVNAFFGWSVAAGADLTGDGIPDLLAGAPLADLGGTNAGVVYVVAGPLVGTTTLETPAARLWIDDFDARAGWSVAIPGDLDGDGAADALVAAPDADAEAPDGSRRYLSGAAWVLRGPLMGDLDLDTAFARVVGPDDDVRMGYALAAGDFDGNGLLDVAVSAAHDWHGGDEAGGVYVFASPLEAVVDGATPTAAMYGKSDNDRAGVSIAAGDLDGDGYADLVVGAPGRDAGGSDSGTVYVAFGPLSGISDLEDLPTILPGEASGDGTGRAVLAGDLDGDGVADLVVGAPGRNSAQVDAGMAYVIYGPLAEDAVLADAQARLAGVEVEEAAGWGLALGGDVDGDGRGDLLVGSPSSSAAEMYGGTVFLVPGGITGEVSLGAAPACYFGDEGAANAGESIAIGDVDGDGRADVVVGVPSADDAAYEGGAVYVFSAGSLDGG